MSKLSICVPTYNRQRMLAELLETIAQQARGGLEVVVSDDGSADGTANFVRRRAARYPVPIRLVAHPSNVGFEANFLSAVAAAEGEYVLLIGDDDALEPGAIDTIFESLQRHPECAGLTLGSTDYDSRLVQRVGQGRLPAPGPVEGAEQVMLTMSDHIGFMSSLVVRRTLWARAVEEIGARRILPLYPHVHIVIHILLNLNPHWIGVPVSCIKYRTENDHLLAKHGWGRRLSIDVEGYREIRRLAFGHRPAGRRFEARIIRTHLLSRVVFARRTGVSTVTALGRVPYLARYYRSFPSFWLLIMPMLVAPSAFVRGMRIAYQAAPGLSARSRLRRPSARQQSEEATHTLG